MSNQTDPPRLPIHDRAQTRMCPFDCAGARLSSHTIDTQLCPGTNVPMNNCTRNPVPQYYP